MEKRAPRAAWCVLIAAAFAVSPARAVGEGNDLIPDIPLGPNTVELEVLVDVGSRVADITNAGDGSGRLFFVQPDGVIRVFKDGMLLPTPFLDAPAFPPGLAMSGLAFHPDHAVNGKLYLLTGEAVPNPSTPDYTAPQSDDEDPFDNLIVEYRVDPGNPDVVDPSTRRELLRIHQAHRIHSMGDLAFGGDGYLYVAVGDGGDTRSGTPTHYNTTGQQTDNPFGSILRIDVDVIGPNGRYAVPPDNPFADGAGGNVPEIFAWGVRNPWRISADRLTGEVYTGVNGDLTIEQIYRVELGDNYGWDTKEGSYLWNASTGEATVDPSPDPQFTPPLAEYDHNNTTEAYGSVIGGFVYRGTRNPDLYGQYVFHDYVAAELIEMDPASGALRRIAVDPGGEQLTAYGEIAWGEGEDGELYIARDGGVILRFVPSAAGDVAGSVSNLALARETDGTVTLSWADSCQSDDDDYEIYEGLLGDFTTHAPLFCSTFGATSKTLAPSAGDVYYLVVPKDGLREGSYGKDGAGSERPPGMAPCLLRAVGSCPAI